MARIILDARLKVKTEQRANGVYKYIVLTSRPADAIIRFLENFSGQVVRLVLMVENPPSGSKQQRKKQKSKKPTETFPLVSLFPEEPVDWWLK